jgi:uncharacterized protein
MEQEEKILRTFHTVAMVGASPKRDRASFRVASYLKEQGYRVIPVNPLVNSILGEKSYPNLASIPDKVEIVDVFRDSEALPEIAEEAINIGARVLWMQEGVVNETAAARALEAGMMVVMNRCMRNEHLKMRGEYSESEE